MLQRPEFGVSQPSTPISQLFDSQLFDSQHNSYSVYVLTGLFTIYYYTSTKEETAIQCQGNIDFTLTSISMQINEST